jgi:predicted ATP-grasp superfamily ATP-dependent carboligase
MSDNIPAVVVGGQVNGLGVVRSLAMGGVRTITVDTTLTRPAMWSRFSERALVENLSGQPLVDSLLRLQKRIGGRPVMILTDEIAVGTVSQHRDALAAAYRFQLPSAEMVETLEDKARFQGFAKQHDLPVPATIVLSQDTDLTQLAGLQYPIIVKPADKRSVHTGRTRRVELVSDADEARAICQEMLATAGQIVVQEWIDGPDSEIYFSLFHRAKNTSTTSIFHGRKVISHPPRVGSTALCVAAPEVADVLGPVTETFVGAADYQGFGSLEFKRSATTGKFLIIEPTVARTDWQEEIATLSGVNLPLIAYRDALGLPPLDAVPVDRAVAWRETFLRGRNGSPTLAGIRTYDGYWRNDDPGPAVVFYAHLAARSVAQRFERQLGRLRLSA